MVGIRAQVILESWTGLPEHQCTNTFHFVVAGPLTDPVATDIILGLSAFYNSIDSLLSPVLTGAVEVKLYDMEQPPPRAPYNPGWGFSITPATGTSGLPEEVAIVLSFHGALPHTPRRRGRLYLGPCATSAFILGSSLQWCRVQPSAVQVIAIAATNLRDRAWTEPLGWYIYSTVNDEMVLITGGWVDNSPDTQRRRGHDPETRNVW